MSNSDQYRELTKRLVKWSEALKERSLRREVEAKLLESLAVGFFAAIASLVVTLLDQRDLIERLFSKESLFFILGIGGGMLSAAIVFLIARWYSRRNEDVQNAKRVMKFVYLSGLKASLLNPKLKKLAD